MGVLVLEMTRRDETATKRSSGGFIVPPVFFSPEGLQCLGATRALLYRAIESRLSRWIRPDQASGAPEFTAPANS
jgi:hypothetical protein